MDPFSLSTDRGVNAFDKFVSNASILHFPLSTAFYIFLVSPMHLHGDPNQFVLR